MPKSRSAATAALTGTDWVSYAALGLAAFFQHLFLGKACFNSDLLAQFGPWRAFLRDQLAQGHFPLWNPYLLGGQPFFADLQNMMAYPPNYLTLLFPVAYGFGVFFFLHFVWAAAGMHQWLLSMGLSRNAARVGALLFAFSSFFWLELIHPPVLAAFSWLPWLFWALGELAKDLKPRSALIAGLLFAMLFLCGSLQMTLGGFYGGGAYFLFRLWTRPGTWSFKKVAVAALFLAWGTLPLLVQFIPTLEFSALCDRRAAPLALEDLDSQWSMKPGTLHQLLLPRFDLPKDMTMAEAAQSPSTAPTPGNLFLAGYGYIGIAAPFLFFWAWRSKERKTALFWGAFAVLSMALSLGTHLPLYGWFYRWVPGFSFIQVPFRFIYLFTLGAVVLAAWGLETFLATLTDPKRRKDALLGSVLYAVLLTLVAFLRPLQDWREIAGLVLGGMALLLYAQASAWRTRGPLLFQAALVLPAVLGSQAYFTPNPASNLDFEKNSGSIPAFARSVLPNRVFFDSRHLYYPVLIDGEKRLIAYPENASCAMGLKDFGGYDPLRLLAQKKVGGLPLPTLVKIGAIEGVLSDTDHGPLPGFKLEFSAPYYFYRHGTPLGHAFAPTEVVQEEDPSKRLAALARPGFDPYRTAVLTDPPPGAFRGAGGVGRPNLRYTLLEDGCDLQRFGIELDHPNLVVFCETMFPGWTARLDGKPVKVFTADHLLRSVFVPAGAHKVEFRFEPLWWKPTLFGFFLWALLTLGFWYRGGPRA
jgi:hypothetical protein